MFQRLTTILSNMFKFFGGIANSVTYFNYSSLLFMKNIAKVLSFLKMYKKFSLTILIFSVLAFISNVTFLIMYSDTYITVAKYFYTPLYLLLAIINWTFIVLIDSQEFSENMEQISWPIEDCSNKMRKRIFLTGAVADAKIILSMVIFFAALINLIFFGNIENIDFVLFQLKFNYPNLSFIYLTLYSAHVFVGIVLSSFVNFSAFLYTSYSQHFEAALLADYIERNLKISSGTETKRKLKIVIEKHVELVNLRKLQKKCLSLKLYTLLYALYGGFAFIYFVTNVALKNCRVFASLLTLTFALVLEMLCSAVQCLDDSSNLIRTAALELPWYTWEVKEQKALLLLILNTNHIEYLKFLGTPINKAFLIKFASKVYSFGTVVIALMKPAGI